MLLKVPKMTKVFHFIRADPDPKDKPEALSIKSCCKGRKTEVLSWELSRVVFTGTSSMGRLTFVFWNHISQPCSQMGHVYESLCSGGGNVMEFGSKLEHRA